LCLAGLGCYWRNGTSPSPGSSWPGMIH
jgi:hypothetical protein